MNSVRSNSSADGNIVQMKAKHYREQEELRESHSLAMKELQEAEKKTIESEYAAKARRLRSNTPEAKKELDRFEKVTKGVVKDQKGFMIGGY